MSRGPRRKGESGIYHVYTRGVNGEAIFVDDADRKKMCYIVGDAFDAHGGELYAWALMTNHVHFVLRNDFDRMPRQIASIKSRYAMYFNGRHGRYGHLFQGRYASKPIDTDAYLIAAVRYVHLNPVAAGLSRTCTYAWSSYLDYVPPGVRPLAAHGERHRPEVATEQVLEAFGGTRRFMAMHALATPAACGKPGQLRRELEDAEVLDAIERALGPDAVERMRGTDIPDRNRLLRDAKTLGYSNARLSRATGLGRSIIQRT